jgi:hypothetical protein
MLTVPDDGTGVLFSYRPFVLIVKMVEVLGFVKPMAREKCRVRQRYEALFELCDALLLENNERDCQ